MAELKILFLFLIIFNDKKELWSNALEIAPQDPEISTKLPSDNELTHVRTKNLSGNVKLTTLELLTTNTPFDELNNVSEVIFEGTTSENKQFDIEPENGQEDALLSSEIGTKAPTDGFEPFALMDVFNSTSGTFPDQNSTEKLITVTPLNKLIDEDFDITRPNVANTETPNYIDSATRDFEENEEMQAAATQNYADIEDLATFMKLDEEFLNTVTDKSEELEFLNEAIEEISSILKSYEDKSQLSPNFEEDDSETKKQAYFETTTKELLREETENNEENVDSVNYETTTNLPAIATVNGNLIEKSTVNDIENESQSTINAEEEEGRHFQMYSTKEYLNENIENLPVIFHSDDDKPKSSKSIEEEESNQEYEDKMDYKTTTTIEDLNQEHGKNSQIITTTAMNIEEENNETKKETNFETTTTSYEDNSMSNNLSMDQENNEGYENENNEMKKVSNFETTTTTYADKLMSSLSVEDEDNEGYEDEMNYETTTTIKNLNEEHEENSQTTTTTTNEDLSEEYEINTVMSPEMTTIKQIFNQPTTVTHNDREVEEENNKGYTDDLPTFETNTREEEVIETTENISSITNSFEDKLESQNGHEEDTQSTEETTTEFSISGRFAEEREDLNKSTEEEEKSHSDSFSGVTEGFEINEHKEETTENYDMSSNDCEEDTTIGITENSNIYDKVHNEQGEREDLSNTTEEKETHFDEEFKIGENNKEDKIENDDCKEDSTISTRKINRTTSTPLNTEDVQVSTTEKSDIYEKVDNEQEVEDKLTINIDINELEKIEETIVREVNEIEEDDLKEINNERTSFYNITESTTNYESKEIFTSSTILSFLKPDGYNQVITTAEMLKTESEKVEEPQISANISGQKQHFSVKIVYNESAFFVPADALLTVQPPNLLNITWKAPNAKMNNSIELNFGNSLRLNLVKDDQMHVHKTALISEPKDKLSDTNLITLEEGIQIYFSNISFLKTDENGAGTLRKNNPVRTLAGEIVGGCIGACILIGIVVYFLAKKFRSKTRNFKPNGDA